MLFTAFTAIGVRAQDEIHNSFALGANGSVSILNVSGYIHITGWDETRVQVDAVKRGSKEDFSQVEIRITESAGRLEINTIYPRGNWRRNTNVSVDIDVKAPRAAMLNSITSTSGEIIISNAGSRVVARSTSGDVEVRNTSGDTNVNSTSGSVKAEHIGGSLTIGSTSGDLLIRQIGGRLMAQATSGDVSVDDVRDDASVTSVSGEVHVNKVGGRLTARATSGSVTVKDVGGDATLESISEVVSAENVKGRVTANGVSADIIIRNANEGVRANAVSGQIEISKSRGLIEARNTSSDIILQDVDSHEVLLNSHNGTIKYLGTVYEDGRYNFESFSGEIEVAIPANTNFTINAKTYSGSLTSDFPLQTTMTTSDNARPRRMQGTHGKEGGATITASGFSADIHLKKR